MSSGSETDSIDESSLNVSKTTLKDLMEGVKIQLIVEMKNIIEENKKGLKDMNRENEKEMKSMIEQNQREIKTMLEYSRKEFERLDENVNDLYNCVKKNGQARKK